MAKAQPKKKLGLGGDVSRTTYAKGRTPVKEFPMKGSKAEKPTWNQKKKK